jgi:DNA-binding response OmpR family regulator
LTRHEFDTLELLARQAGRIVSPARISEHLYGDNYEGRSNTVAAYIGHLRRKIDQHFHPRLIHARWCHGYMLGQV